MKKIALLVPSMIHSGISGFFTPWLLMLSFNLNKGPVNNPEGVMFIPFGIIMLLSFLVIDILIKIRGTKIRGTEIRGTRKSGGRFYD